MEKKCKRYVSKDGRIHVVYPLDDFRNKFLPDKKICLERIVLADET